MEESNDKTKQKVGGENLSNLSKLHQEFDQNSKAIDDLVKGCLDEEGNIDESDPQKLQQTYKQIEYLALTDGKNAVGKAFTKVMVMVGAESLEKAIDREKGKYDAIIKGYKEEERTISNEMRDLSKKKVEALSQQDQLYHLGETLEKQGEVSTQLISGKEDVIDEMIKTPGYDKNKRKDLIRLRSEIEELKIKKEDYASKEAESALKEENLRKYLGSIEKQSVRQRNRLYACQNRKYDAMAHQTPTVYLLTGLKTAQKFSELTATVATINRRVKGFRNAAVKIEGIIDKAMNRDMASGEESLESEEDYEAKYEDSNAPLIRNREQRLSVFRNRRRERFSPGIPDFDQKPKSDYQAA